MEAPLHISFQRYMSAIDLYMRCRGHWLQAHIPPEYMLELLPQREVLGPGIVEGHARIEAKPSFDIWSLGIVVYELFTGSSLFCKRIDAPQAATDVNRFVVAAKDVNNDCCTDLKDCHALASWVSSAVVVGVLLAQLDAPG